MFHVEHLRFALAILKRRQASPRVRAAPFPYGPCRWGFEKTARFAPPFRQNGIFAVKRLQEGSFCAMASHFSLLL
ncbi:hypothetical protein HMPREF7215_1439 [Pyramidobacter piscolens W5455]|uniref:Uncharacterized protein n=1 Tax=Pyramidobacter piscolens W5455 TaxID=352165 RepID=A0ABM9ZXE7_9BACT|nr:hypothetical protein HMPREF7215_1439 [Pyramidobacter piscolens W5455]